MGSRRGLLEANRSSYSLNQAALYVVTVFAVAIFLVTNVHFFSRSPPLLGHSTLLDTEGGSDNSNAHGRSHNSLRRLDRTLVMYVYNAVDTEHQRNFAYFLRYGIDEKGTSYRIIITQGPTIKEFPRLPELPRNAAYLHTNVCTHSWGAIKAVMKEMPIAEHDYFMVLDSSVRGPYLPPYVASSKVEGLHWTEAFTNKLDAKVKLVGSLINCEGAPLNGNAAGPWRGNPTVSPNAWATDSVGWRLLTENEEIFKCYSSPWDVKYYSEYGASLAILSAGYTLDSLLTRYQGVDWGLPSSWQCNRRVRPDFEHHYDGISITPYETIFVPISSASLSARWSFADAAERYERWMDRQLRPLETRPGVHTNQWITKNWALKAEKLVYMNTRGPECFDFEYYSKENPDLGALSDQELNLWEHFLLIGQFQARPYRFKCTLPVGNSFRLGYALARGPRCFDHLYYYQQHADLQSAGFSTASELFDHFVQFGQFEQRKIRFTCADTLSGLTDGFDTVQGDFRDESSESDDMNDEDVPSIADDSGYKDDPDMQQAVKSVLVTEVVKDLIKGSNRKTS